MDFRASSWPVRKEGAAHARTTSASSRPDLRLSLVYGPVSACVYVSGCEDAVRPGVCAALQPVIHGGGSRMGRASASMPGRSDRLYHSVSPEEVYKQSAFVCLTIPHFSPHTSARQRVSTAEVLIAPAQPSAPSGTVTGYTPAYRRRSFVSVPTAPPARGAVSSSGSVSSLVTPPRPPLRQQPPRPG